MNTDWIPVAIDWEKIRHFVPEAFFSVLIGSIGFAAFKWLIAIKFVPNWIPIAFLPPVLACFTYSVYMGQTDGSRVPLWAVDAEFVRKIIAASVASTAVLPVILAITSHVKKARTGNTEFLKKEGK